MPEKICIVDDNMINRRLLTGILRNEAYELVEARDGQEAIDVISKELPDLVLLDVMMPKKDGFQVCEELQRNDRTARIPVIFISARTRVEDKIKGLNAGGADYVTKPFDAGEVLARVKTQLNIARLTKELLKANEELTRRQRRMDEDLAVAAGIQQSLLPQLSPDMENTAIAWRFMPCESIGGDIFNVLRLDETHWAAYMLDVSGHGLPSALVTVSVSQMLHPATGILLKKTRRSCPGYAVRRPAEVLDLLDQEYPIERFDKYFTVTYLIMNVKEGIIQYSNAAHPPPILLRRDGTLELLEEGGGVIGLGGVLPFQEGSKKIGQGDKLLIYTDGILEYEDKQGQFYGQNRLHDTLLQLRGRSIKGIVDGVIEAVMDFGDHHPPGDDVTLLGIGFNGESN